MDKLVDVAGAAGPARERRTPPGENVKAYTLLAPTLIIVAAGLAAPLAILLLFSLWTQNFVEFDRTLTLENYRQIFARDAYFRVFLRSIAISAMVTLITVCLAYPLACFVAFRVHRRKTIWLILITLPFWTSYLLRVFAWKIILGYEGVINSGLTSLGLIAAPLEFLLYNPVAVVITLAHAWAAYAILPIYVSLEKIDRDLFAAATDLGDGPVRRFLRITLPLSMPGIIAASVIIFIPTVGDYVTPQLVGGPTGAMIGNLIQVQFARANNWPMGSAISILAMLAVTVITLGYLVVMRALARIPR